MCACGEAFGSVLRTRDFILADQPHASLPISPPLTPSSILLPSFGSPVQHPHPFRAPSPRGDPRTPFVAPWRAKSVWNSAALIKAYTPRDAVAPLALAIILAQTSVSQIRGDSFESSSVATECQFMFCSWYCRWIWLCARFRKIFMLTYIDILYVCEDQDFYYLMLGLFKLRFLKVNKIF